MLTEQITKNAQPVTSSSSACHDCDIENCPGKPTGPAPLLDRQIRRNRHNQKGLPTVLALSRPNGSSFSLRVTAVPLRNIQTAARNSSCDVKFRRGSPGNSYNRHGRRQLLQLKQQEGFAQIRHGATDKVYPFALTALFFLSGEIPFSITDEVSHTQGTHLDQLRLQCLAVPGTAGNLLTRRARLGQPATSDDGTHGNAANFPFGLLRWSRPVLNQGHSCSESIRAGNVTYLRQVLVLSRRLLCRAMRFSSNSVPPITALRFRRLGSSTLKKRRTVIGVTGRILSSRCPGWIATSSIDSPFRLSGSFD